MLIQGWLPSDATGGVCGEGTSMMGQEADTPQPLF